MPKIFRPLPRPVEDQQERLWSDPEAVQDACIALMDTCLGHDVDRLAAVSGISRRELNKQRERRADRLGKQWLHRIAILLRSTSMKFGPARTAPAVRFLAHAAGHELANAVPAAAAAGEREAALALISRSVREVCDAAAKFAARAEDGIDQADALALLPEVEEGMAELRATYNALLLIAEKQDRTAGPRSRA